MQTKNCWLKPCPVAPRDHYIATKLTSAPRPIAAHHSLEFKQRQSCSCVKSVADASLNDCFWCSRSFLSASESILQCRSEDVLAGAVRDLVMAGKSRAFWFVQGQRRNESTSARRRFASPRFQASLGLRTERPVCTQGLGIGFSTAARPRLLTGAVQLPPLARSISGAKLAPLDHAPRSPPQISARRCHGQDLAPPKA